MVFVRCPFFEGVAGEFFALTAVVEIFICRAIVKIASAVPNGLSLGRDIAATCASFIQKELAGVAVYAADG